MKTNPIKRLLAAAICGLILATTLSSGAQAQTVSRIAYSALVQPVVKGKSQPGYQQIFSMNPDGSGVAQLTSASASAMNPSWSPGQQYIAFGRTNTLFVMEARGEANAGRTFAVGSAGNFGADWSPDGSKLCYLGIGPTYGLWIVDVNPATAQVGTPVLIRTGECFWPAWSPDGTRIAFCYSYDDGPTQIISVLDLATGHEISFGAGPVGSYDFNPRWKPDATQIAFSGVVSTTSTARNGKQTTSTYNEIFIANADGSGIVQATNLKSYSSFPAWSPDGIAIAFRSDFSGATAIYTMPLATGSVRLVRSPGNAPDWAP
jgi:TolB protein